MGSSRCEVEPIEELKGSDQENLKEMVAEGGQRSTKRAGNDEPESDRGDLKKLKTDEDEEAGQEKKNTTTVKILVEYAKSERSSCEKCSEKIESKSIRLGFSSWDPRGFENTKWHHIDCFFPLDADLCSAESIQGFSDLKSSDQEKLKKLLTGVDQSSREVIFTSNLIIPSSDNPSSPQPATPSSTDSSLPQHTPLPSFAQCASQKQSFPPQTFQMNQHAFNQMGRNKAKGKKGTRSSGSSSTTNVETLARLMASELATHHERTIVMSMNKEQLLALLEIRRKEVELRRKEVELRRMELELRERKLEMEKSKQREEEIMFYYMQPYNHLTGAALKYVEEMRAEIKARWNLR